MASLGLIDSIKDYKNQIKKFNRYSEKEFRKLIEYYWLLYLSTLAPHNSVFQKPPNGFQVPQACSLPFEEQTFKPKGSKKKTIKRIYTYDLDHFINAMSFPHQDFQKHLLQVCSSPTTLMANINRLAHMVYGTNRTILYGELDDISVILKFEKVALIFHEFLLGKHIINDLRSTLPTFVWTYGLKPMSGFPFFINGYPNMDLCDNLNIQDINLGEYRKDNQMLLLLEHVPGENLASHIHSMDLEEICLVLIHIFISLNIAYTKHKFVHWDLHTENIILRKLEQPSCYQVEHQGSLGYLLLHEYLPIIFDYGLSSGKAPKDFSMNSFTTKFYGDERKIELDEFRNFECIRSGLNPFWANPWIDIIRLFTSLIIDADHDGRDDVKQFFLTFVNRFFFPGDSTQDAFDAVHDNYCFIPPNEFMNQITFEDFLNAFVTHIQETFPSFEYTSPDPDGDIITSTTYPQKQEPITYDIFSDVNGLIEDLSNKKEYFLDYLVRGFIHARLGDQIPMDLKDTLKKEYSYKDIIKKTKQFLKGEEKGVDLTVLLAEFVKKSYIVQPEEDEEEFMENFCSLFYD